MHEENNPCPTATETCELFRDVRETGNSLTRRLRWEFIDEITSSFTHALGGYLSAAALVLLIVFAVRSGEQVAWKVVAGAIFASTMIILYSASAIYHAVMNFRIKEICRACDQMAIYALIAGTYTPFCLVTLRQTHPILSWTIFGLVWAMTISGIVFKIFAQGEFKYLTTATYLIMGWLGLVLIYPLSQTMPLGGIVWLVLGGVLYSLGVIFFLWRSIPLNHTIWHLFVIAGTISHFFGILFYVIM